MTKTELFLAERFVHMLPGDVSLWQRFLEKHGEYFDRFEYDVHVGQGVELNPVWPGEIVRAARALTQKRIDVVGYRNDEVWIIEIKPDAGLSALGQLLAYKILWVKEHGLPSYLYLAIVTDRLNPDETFLFETHNIKTYLMLP